MISYTHKVKFKKHETKLTHHGIVTFMCPKCYALTNFVANVKFDVRPVTQSTLLPIDLQFNIVCQECKHHYTAGIIGDNIDANIAPMISKLNKHGFTTKYCCEGHIHNEYINPSYIVFDIDDYKKETVLYNCISSIYEDTDGMWDCPSEEEDSNNSIYNDFTIRTTLKNGVTKDQELKALNNWIDNILISADKAEFSKTNKEAETNVQNEEIDESGN